MKKKVKTSLSAGKRKKKGNKRERKIEIRENQGEKYCKINKCLF